MFEKQKEINRIKDVGIKRMVINPKQTSCQMEACQHQITDQAHQNQNIDKYGISREFYKETLTDVC